MCLKKRLSPPSLEHWEIASSISRVHIISSLDAACCFMCFSKKLVQSCQSDSTGWWTDNLFVRFLICFCVSNSAFYMTVCFCKALERGVTTLKWRCPRLDSALTTPANRYRALPSCTDEQTHSDLNAVSKCCKNKILFIHNDNKAWQNTSAHIIQFEWRPNL